MFYFKVYVCVLVRVYVMNAGSRRDQEGAELLRAGVTGGSLQKPYTLLTAQLLL